jgi:hypothetical protein
MVYYKKSLCLCAPRQPTQGLFLASPSALSCLWVESFSRQQPDGGTCNPSPLTTTHGMVHRSIEIDASSRAANHKIVGPCTHSAQASTHHACAEDGYLKHPHPPNIDKENWWDRWMVYGWTWGWQAYDMWCTLVKAR